jgi:hypothetical protein
MSIERADGGGLYFLNKHVGFVLQSLQHGGERSYG